MPNIPQAMRDSAVSSFYNAWKQHVKPLCGGYYTHTGGGTGVPEGVRAITISEGHGYGMMAVAYMAGFDPDARKMFDGMHTFWRKFPSINNPDLMAWVILENCMLPNAVTGDLTPDSASDGDLDIAYAYLIAHHQWGSDGPINYLAEAKKVIAAIKAARDQPRDQADHAGRLGGHEGALLPAALLAGAHRPLRARAARRTSTTAPVPRTSCWITSARSGRPPATPIGTASSSTSTTTSSTASSRCSAAAPA